MTVEHFEDRQQCDHTNIADVLAKYNLQGPLMNALSELNEKCAPESLDNVQSLLTDDALANLKLAHNEYLGEGANREEAQNLLSAMSVNMADYNTLVADDMGTKPNFDASVVSANFQAMQEQMNEAIERLRENARNYQASAQLNQTGQHVSNVQTEINQRNEQLLSNLSSDFMTAKRVSTINQQNTIHNNVVISYLQLSSIFVGVGILLTFLFSFNVVQSFFKHPIFVLQILLVLLALAYIICMIVKAVLNNNHYNMLYQERVFPTPADYESVTQQTDACSDTSSDTDSTPDTDLLNDIGFPSLDTSDTDAQDNGIDNSDVATITSGVDTSVDTATCNSG